MTSAPARSILVVDDDHDMVDTLCDVLELRGWRTLRAYDGESAVSLATSTAVDWVLMDVRMPHMTGVQALEEIRRTRPDQRFVLMTAFASPEVRDRADRAATHVLKKPFEPTALFSLLE
jgi:CheY-like chemotaxis protein